MNRYEYNGNLKKGKSSQAAKQAFADIKADKEMQSWYVDFWGIDRMLDVIITEDMLGIEL